MKVGIYTNIQKDKDLSAQGEIKKILEDLNLEFVIMTFDEKISKGVLAECDFVVAFGGDGTMLSISALCAKYNIPVLGVNLGKIGFLTEIDLLDIKKAINLILENKYFIEKRTMIKATVKGKTFYAINEFVLGGSIHEQIGSVSINIDDTYADTVRCDGVIVSTPTGSTAYSLSCNGPILAPNVKALIVNTICPHSLHSLPMVISDDSKVSLSACNKSSKLLADGYTIATFEENTEILIEKSKKYASFIRFDDKENFYQKLLKKLSYWGE